MCDVVGVRCVSRASLSMLPALGVRLGNSELHVDCFMMEQVSMWAGEHAH